MKNTYWLVCFAMLSVTACSNDKKIQPLIGRWELSFGELNGQPAPSLEKIFFEFSENNSLKTNFTLSEQEETGTFNLKETVLTQNTTEPIQYEIIAISDTSLEMTTALRGLDFKLYLKKATTTHNTPPQ